MTPDDMAGQVPLRVLAVDDDAMCRKLVRRCIESHGHTVEEADDGREGLQALLRRDFDVVVVDLHMKKMEGIAFIQEARKIWPWLGFIITSGHLDDNAMRRADALDVSSILNKPVSIHDLYDAVLTEAARSAARLEQSPNSISTPALQQRQLGMLRQLGDMVTAAADMDEALLKLGEALPRLLPCAAIGILTCNTDEPQLILTAHKPLNQPAVDSIRDEMVNRYALLSGLPLMSDDVTVQTNGTTDAQTHEELASTFTLPILAEGEVHGMLTLASTEADAYTSSDISFLYHIAHQFSSNLAATTRMRQLTIVDDLTNLNNRRFFDETLADAWSSSCDDGPSLAIVILDVDHFKRINDTYGHPVGDEILRELAQIIRGASRASDTASRYGGDELVIVMQGPDQDQAASFAERIRRLVDDHVFCQTTYRLSASVSIGVALNNSTPAPTSPEALLANADQALYQAKRAGRNCVCVWPDSNQILSGAADTPKQSPPPSVATGEDVDDSKHVGRVMVIDDDPSVGRIIQIILEKQGHSLIMADSFATAKTTLSENTGEVDLVITDLVLPDGSGLDILKMVKGLDDSIMRIVITGHASIDNAVECIDQGAFAFIEKPVSADQLRTAVDRALGYRRLLLENVQYRLHLEEMVEEKSSKLADALEQLEQSYRFSLEALAALLDAREETAGSHSTRVRDLSTVLGRTMMLSETELGALAQGALLHDIGKIGIPDAILLKPDELTDEERETMQSHSEIGHRIIKSSPALAAAAEIVLSHHERYDGKGYPRQLAGDDICFGARIFTVIDTYDAMRSDRIYRPAMSKENAVNELVKNRGLQFDPDVVDTFIGCIDEMEKVGQWPSGE